MGQLRKLISRITCSKNQELGWIFLVRMYLNYGRVTMSSQAGVCIFKKFGGLFSSLTSRLKMSCNLLSVKWTIYDFDFHPTKLDNLKSARFPLMNKRFIIFENHITYWIMIPDFCNLMSTWMTWYKIRHTFYKNMENPYVLKLKFAIFLGHSTNKNIYTSIFPNICQFTNEMEGYIEELTRTSQCLNT